MEPRVVIFLSVRNGRAMGQGMSVREQANNGQGISTGLERGESSR